MIYEQFEITLFYDKQNVKVANKNTNVCQTVFYKTKRTTPQIRSKWDNCNAEKLINAQ